MRLSLAMCVKNAESTIRACLETVIPFVDEVVIVNDGSTDNTVGEIMGVCANATIIGFEDPDRHPERGWTSDFARLRNISFDACTGDAILWLDADDIVVNPKAMRDAIDDYFTREPVPADVMSMLYDYKQDENGNRILDQSRWRVIRKGAMEWEYVVHEELKPCRPNKTVDCDGAEFYVSHTRQDDESSGERNLWIIDNFMAGGGTMTDRYWQNYGTSLFVLKRYEEAAEAYRKAIESQGANPETDYMTRLHCGNAYAMLGKHGKAMAEQSAAQNLFPARRAPYLHLAETVSNLGNMDAALDYVAVAEACPRDIPQGFSWSPIADAVIPLQVRARAFMVKQRYEDAYQCYEALCRIFPKDTSLKAVFDGVGSVIRSTRLYDAFRVVAGSLGNESRDTLYRMAPEELATYPEVVMARLPERPSDRPRAVFCCGEAQRPWGPASLLGGVGGSEEAVILLSRQLVSLGWHVEVYGFPPANSIGEDSSGVVWLPYAAWDEADDPDVFVSWRQPDKVKIAPNASQRYLWLHDLVVPPFYTPEVCDSLDGIFCLSEYHAAALPPVAREKLILTTNGLDSSFFVDGPNHPRKFIYASSPDRGLLPLLEQWPVIRKSLPDAELDIYYGFTEQYLSEMSRFPHLRTLKTKIDGLIKQDGVFWHGMVGQAELCAAFAKAGFLAYPCIWSETSCITAMRAQALGCIPVTSRYVDSALPETVKYDLGPEARAGKIDDHADWLAEWTDALITSAQRTDLSDYRIAMKSYAREEFSWLTVAKSWSRMWLARQSSEKSPSKAPLQSQELATH